MTALAGRDARPGSVTAIRVLAGIQIAIGVSVTALSGFALIYLLFTTLDTALGGRHHSLLVPALCLAAGVLLSFVLLASLGLLRRANPIGRRIVLVVELLLAGVTVVLVFSAHSRSAFLWVPSMVELMCAAGVVALLHTSDLRSWNGASV